MAIITSGSFDDFAIRPSALDYHDWGTYHFPRPVGDGDVLTASGEVANPAPADLVEFGVSPDNRGLALARLRLDKDFQKFLPRMLKVTSDVYFLAWCWDMSGKSTSVYPGVAAAPESALIPMRAGDVREFMGAGALLFPARPITAGLAARIQIWECKQKTRDFGKTVSSVAKVIQDSELNALLTVVAAATGVTTAAVAAVEQAALTLTRVVGEVLKNQSDNHVDFYEGYFPATDSWTAGELPYSGSASQIVLRQF